MNEIQKFKIGETVKLVSNTRNTFSSSVRIVQIAKIWKNGTIVISNGLKFQPDGIERTSTCYSSFVNYITHLEKNETVESIQALSLIHI